MPGRAARCRCSGGSTTTSSAEGNHADRHTDGTGRTTVSARGGGGTSPRSYHRHALSHLSREKFLTPLSFGYLAERCVGVGGRRPQGLALNAEPDAMTGARVHVTHVTTIPEGPEGETETNSIFR